MTTNPDDYDLYRHNVHCQFVSEIKSTDQIILEELRKLNEKFDRLESLIHAKVKAEQSLDSNKQISGCWGSCWGIPSVKPRGRS